MKLYVVSYCANEFDEFGYNDPYPIYYSLDKNKARKFFKEKVDDEINYFNKFIKEHQEFENNENYQINQNEENYLELYFGKWSYEYSFEEVEFDVDLRYNK